MWYIVGGVVSILCVFSILSVVVLLLLKAEGIDVHPYDDTENHVGDVDNYGKS